MSTPELPTLDPAALAQVSGGTSTSTSTSTQSDALLTALTGILSSIQSLAQQPSSGINQQEMLLLMLIMQRRNQPVVVPSPWSAWSPPNPY